MIAVVDSGVGNLRSVEKALRAVGAEVALSADPEQILGAEKVALPGVGAFGDTMAGLAERGLLDVIHSVVSRGTPLLGICVGMQVLFDRSQEMGEHAGFGFLPGVVRRFELPGLKVPHTGWNQVEPKWNSPLLRGLPAGCYAYFNHSYYCDPAEAGDVLADSVYGLPFAAAVQRGQIYGVQFHPEKSQEVGLAVLRNFVNLS